MKNLKIKSLAPLAALILATVPCHALTIVINYVPVGSTIPAGAGGTTFGTSRAVNSSLIHPSNDIFYIIDIVTAAASYWSTIYNFSSGDMLTIDFGMCDAANIPGGGDAGSYPTAYVTSGAGTGNIRRGSMGISVAHNWYVDPVPTDWSEYGAVTSTNVAYTGHSGQFVESQRFTGVGGGDAGYSDLLSAVMHEMGHLLGLNSNLGKYTSEVADGDVDVTTWHVIAGTSWLSSGGHLTSASQPEALMHNPDITGHRKWPSQADIASISQIEGWFTGSWGAGGGGPQGDAANRPHN